ncbi:hypothetical protein AB0886_05310 [Streptomyces sp. NPDC024062]|uniref:hypothetical protein n=1 Tax=unclassified Streptomyces TaxID=2593676 RepID=UPI00343D453F
MTTTPHSIRGIRPAGIILDEAVIRPDAVDHLNRQQAAADLRAIREQWGDLLAAIEKRPAAVWPPLDSRALGAEPEPVDDGPSVGRTPLTLREHPAPLNLAALDAACRVEEALFEACDAIAERVQRPVRRTGLATLTRSGGPLRRQVIDPADRDDPARWTLPTNRTALLTGRITRVFTGTDPRTAADRAALAEHQAAEQRARHILDGTEPEWPAEGWDEDERPAPRALDEVPVTSAGSRAYGLHWAAVWLEGRALDEPHGDLFTATPAPVVESLADVARRARRIVERALGRDGRPTRLDRPCPWCGGLLTAHTRSGDPDAAAVVCATGEACGAPVVLDRGRRIWRGAELCNLYVAMKAAEQRAA